MADKHRCIIVDDELASREVLATYLGKYCPDVEVCGKAPSVDEAITLIDRTSPAIVFLDIEMPFKSGFDLLASYGDRPFQVVFVTAYSDYALNAIQMSAADYLLKPVSIDQLQAAVRTVIGRIHERDSLDRARVLLENIHGAPNGDRRIVLPLIDGFEVVRAKDIVRCEAEDNFTRFHMNDGSKRLICRPMKHYEQALVPLGFVRVHRSHMVKADSIKRYVKGKGGMLFLHDGSEIPVSETHKQALLDLFR